MNDQKVLIVDDEEDLREVYSEYLQSSGFKNILEMSDGLDAFAFCLKEKVSLILLDHKMPYLLGADFLKALRDKPGPNQDTPVIIISGFIGDFKESLQSIEKTYFLEKPVMLESLLRYVKMSLYGKEAA